MTMSTLFTILAIGVVFYLMRRSGGGCCGGHDHGDKNKHGDHGSSGSGLDSDHEDHLKKLDLKKNETDKL